MGTIRVGKSNPKEYSPMGFGMGQKKSAPKVLTEEQKEKLLDSIGKMPVENRVAALRSAGLVDEANEYERHLADEQARMLRANRLAEIMAMPLEERLSLLLAEGYDEEAKALSESLSFGKEERTDDGHGEEGEGVDGTVDSPDPVEVKEDSDGEGSEESDASATTKKSARKKSDGNGTE